MNRNPETVLRAKYEVLASTMNEVGLRLWAATVARALGRGGIALVARVTGLTRERVTAGIRDLNEPAHAAVRATGRLR